MNTPHKSTETLLKNILHSPTEENYAQMVAFVSGPGLEEFIASLRGNNTLSFIFLKNYAQKWIDAGILVHLYDEQFVLFLVQACLDGVIAPIHWAHVADFLEILSANYRISDGLLPFLLSHRNSHPRVLLFIDAIFKKYTLHPRSDRLFTEINRSISLFFPVFEEFLFSPEAIEEIERAYQAVLISAQQIVINSANTSINNNINIVNKNNQFIYETLLSIFYSLTYQDIHHLFEDNILIFFKTFFILFPNFKHPVNLIFDLFITRYPEITNFDLIVLTLSGAGEIDPLLINTLTNAFSHSGSFLPVIVEFLKRVIVEPTEEDWLISTQNIVRGVDHPRGCLHRLIRLVRCNPFLFTGEPRLFIASVMRYRDQSLIEDAFKLIRSEDQSSDQLSDQLIFSTFRYLLTIREYAPCPITYLETNTRFICMRYLSGYLKSKDSYHRDRILSNSHSSKLGYFPDESPVTTLGLRFDQVLGLLKSFQDEFSAELLFRIVKFDESLLTLGFYEFLQGFLGNILTIPLPTLTYLMEIYTLLSLKLGKYDLGIVETILNGEMVDFYNVCFLYVSVLLGETVIKESFILEILSQDSLWQIREFHPGLSFILITACKKGIIGKDQVETISNLLGEYYRVVVYHKLGIRTREESTVEGNYLINGIFDGNWFLENFMDRKYARLVLKKLVGDKNVMDEIKQKVFEKNIGNVEYEGVAHCIVRYFDI